MAQAFAQAQTAGQPMDINAPFGSHDDSDRASLLTFPEGLPGFEELKHFKLLQEENAPNVFCLQAVDAPYIALPVVAPELFQVDYRLTLSAHEMALLGLEREEDALVLVTVAQADGEQQPRANFTGPIIVNTKTRTAVQKVLTRVSGAVLIDGE